MSRLILQASRSVLSRSMYQLVTIFLFSVIACLTVAEDSIPADLTPEVLMKPEGALVKVSGQIAEINPFEPVKTKSYLNENDEIIYYFSYQIQSIALPENTILYLKDQHTEGATIEVTGKLKLSNETEGTKGSNVLSLTEVSCKHEGGL